MTTELLPSKGWFVGTCAIAHDGRMVFGPIAKCIDHEMAQRVANGLSLAEKEFFYVRHVYVKQSDLHGAVTVAEYTYSYHEGNEKSLQESE